jgi:hypothetical protein
LVLATTGGRGRCGSACVAHQRRSSSSSRNPNPNPN